MPRVSQPFYRPVFGTVQERTNSGVLVFKGRVKPGMKSEEQDRGGSKIQRREPGLSARCNRTGLFVSTSVGD